MIFCLREMMNSFGSFSGQASREGYIFLIVEDLSGVMYDGSGN